MRRIALIKPEMLGSVSRVWLLGILSLSEALLAGAETKPVAVTPLDAAIEDIALEQERPYQGLEQIDGINLKQFQAWLDKNDVYRYGVMLVSTERVGKPRLYLFKTKPEKSVLKVFVHQGRIVHHAWYDYADYPVPEQ